MKSRNIIKIFTIVLLFFLLHQNVSSRLNFGTTSAVRNVIEQKGPKDPVIISMTPEDAMVGRNEDIEFTCEAADPNGDAITFQWSCSAGLITGTGDSVIWTAPDDTGVYSIKCRAIDPEDNFTEESVSVNSINSTPIISSLVAGAEDIRPGETASLTCTASDPNGDSLSYLWSCDPVGGTFSGTGNEVIFRAPNNTGTQTISVKVSDIYGSFSTSQTSIQAMNQSPSIQDILKDPPLMKPGETTSLTCLSTDSDGDTLSYIWSSDQGTISGSGNSIIFTAPMETGTFSINCTVDDGYYSQASDTVTVYVSSFREWTRLYGTSELETMEAVTISDSGFVYISGETRGGLETFTNAGYNDVFLAKYNTEGERLWTYQWGGSSHDYGLDLATDSAGNIYVTGYTQSGFDGLPVNETTDVFLTKFTSDGVKLWTKLYGSPGIDTGSGIAISAGDDIYLTGQTSGEMYSNPSQGGRDAFLLKLDNTGSIIWTRQWGSADSEGGVDIVIDVGGNICVSGITEGSMPGNSNIGYEDPFVTVFDSDGNEQWTKQWGSTSWEYGGHISTDDAGNIYVCGETYGSINFQSNAGVFDIFVTKLDSTGNITWVKQFGTSSYDTPYGIATDSSGNIYLSAGTQGSFSGYTNQGIYDIVVLKIAPDGSRLWTREWGTTTSDKGIGIAPTVASDVYLIGNTSGNLDGYSNAGSQDIFITKCNF